MLRARSHGENAPVRLAACTNLLRPYFLKFLQLNKNSHVKLPHQSVIHRAFVMWNTSRCE